MVSIVPLLRASQLEEADSQGESDGVLEISSSSSIGVNNRCKILVRANYLMALERLEIQNLKPLNPPGAHQRRHCVPIAYTQGAKIPLLPHCPSCAHHLIAVTSIQSAQNHSPSEKQKNNPSQQQWRNAKTPKPPPRKCTTTPTTETANTTSVAFILQPSAERSSNDDLHQQMTILTRSDLHPNESNSENARPSCSNQSQNAQELLQDPQLATQTRNHSHALSSSFGRQRHHAVL